MGKINKRYKRKIFSDTVFFAYQQNVKWIEKSDSECFAITFGCIDESIITVIFDSINERDETYKNWKEYVNDEI